MLLIPKKALLLIAAFVWLAAGFSVCGVGVFAMVGWTLPVVVGFIVVHVLFLGMFIGISNRHIRRIISYTDKLISVFKFFDAKSYITIAVMIVLGVAVRLSGLVPASAIASFYGGLGLALIVSAVYYVTTYVALCDELTSQESEPSSYR
jgi:hypothetical protein